MPPRRPIDPGGIAKFAGVIRQSEVSIIAIVTAASEPLVRLPASPADRLLAVAGVCERALAALARRLRRGQAPLTREDLGRGTREAGAPASWAARLAAAPPPGASGPVLVLAALPWAFRVQRPQQLAVALATLPEGPPVVYLETFLRTRLQPRRRLLLDTARLAVVRLRLPGRPDPFREPFPAGAAPILAADLLGRLAAPPSLILAQLPFWLPFARALRDATGAPLVYDRIDLHTAFPGVPPAVGDTERTLIAACSAVTATAPALAELPRDLGIPVRLLPNAVAPGDFPAAPFRPDRRPAVAGFVGALDARVDAEALARAARALPAWRFDLAGRVEDPRVAALAEQPNVTLRGEIPHAAVPAFLATLDLGLIPYRDTAATRTIDPVKLYEMLAAGLPVVARRLPALGRFAEVVTLYDRPEELAAAIEAARADDGEPARTRRREAARDESWERRARELWRLATGEGEEAG